MMIVGCYGKSSDLDNSEYLPNCPPRNISGSNFDEERVPLWECGLGRPEFCFSQGGAQDEHLGGGVEEDPGDDHGGDGDH